METRRRCTMNEATHPVGIRMSPALYERLVTWATTERRSVTASVTIAIEEALDRRQIEADAPQGTPRES